MLAMPFIGAAVGSVIGIAFLDNWKAGGFWGIMVGMVISIVGQQAFFSRR